MATRYVGAIDQGTSRTRGLIVDHDGTVVGEHAVPIESIYPEPGLVEHDPVEIRTSAETALSGALADAGVDPEGLAALGVSVQRGTTVLWDAATGEPVHNAIGWQDQRTADRVETLRAEQMPLIHGTTGLIPDVYASAPKIEWLLSADATPPDLRARAERGEILFGTLDAWLVYALTGGDAHVTDVTNAAMTMLCDLDDLAWSGELLAEFDLPRAMLPEIRPSSDAEPYGYTDPDGPIGAEVPITAAFGDQQAALFGATCFDAGDAKITTGTGSFLQLNTGEEPVTSYSGLLTLPAFQRSGSEPRYVLEGSIPTTGAAVQWLADVGIVDDVAHAESLAGRVDTTEGVYFVPAFAGLGAPIWDRRARGTLLGLTLDTAPEHIVRAALEGIAFQLRDVLETVETDADAGIDRFAVDGGAVENDVLCQLQADVLEVPIDRPPVTEATALGAAYGAGLAVEYWSSLEALRERATVERTFEPEQPAADVADRYERWETAIERARDWASRPTAVGPE